MPKIRISIKDIDETREQIRQHLRNDAHKNVNFSNIVNKLKCRHQVTFADEKFEFKKRVLFDID